MLFEVEVRHTNSHYDWLSKEVVAESKSVDELRDGLHKIFEAGAPVSESPFFDWNCADPNKSPHDHSFVMRKLDPIPISQDGIQTA